MTNFSDTIILTGAGFTANFGGFLAKEMWSKIFNNPKMRETTVLKEELKKDFDFEKIYSKVIGNQIELHPEEYTVFVNCLNEAYLAMDELLKNISWQSLGIHQNPVGDFLNYFKNGNGGVGSYFTLNQDLFLERYFGWQPLGPQFMKYKGNFGALDLQDLNSDQLKRLPNENELNDFKNSISDEFLFVKLHGSQKWIAQDARDTKIIGINKIEAIDRIPLLKWYLELFNEAICKGNRRLVIVGYSFNDEHINNSIIKAIREYGLKLYIINPESPDDFKFRMNFKYPKGVAINDTNEATKPIWDAVEGYFPYTLKQLFPVSQIQTDEKREVFNALGIPLIN